MTKEEQQAKLILQDALNWVKETYLVEPSKLKDCHGICKAVEYFCNYVRHTREDVIQHVHDQLTNLISTWPHCKLYTFKDKTGELVKCTVFPVGGSSEWVMEVYNGTIWKNLKRLELLEYLIQEVNKDE